MIKRLLATGIALAFFVGHHSYADKIKVMSEDSRPQELIPASEFLDTIATSDMTQSENVTDVRSHSDHDRSSNRWGWGGWGLGYGWGSYYYPSYYYPYYYYPSYYYPWLDNRSANAETPAPVKDREHVPVVCFASDSSGSYYAHADTLSNVVSAQDRANHECLTSGGSSCTQNLGCAIAYH